MTLDGVRSAMSASRSLIGRLATARNAVFSSLDGRGHSMLISFMILFVLLLIFVKPVLMLSVGTVLTIVMIAIGAFAFRRRV